MELRLMLDRNEFKSKPDRFVISKLHGKMKQESIEIEELARLLAKGCTFKPALLNGTKSDSWISQQVFALDFDNDTTIEKELSRCKVLGINPVFAYTSLSHTEEKHKFRLIFVTDGLVTDQELRGKMQVTLINTFKKSDRSTKDATRIFLGGKKIVYEDYGARISIDEFLKEYYSDEYYSEISKGDKKKSESKKPIKKKEPSKIEYNEVSENVLALKRNDIKFIQKKLNITEKKVFENDAEFYEYIITEIDLKELIEVKVDYFNCIFHEDGNPSAGIFTNEEGHQIYKCHSGQCNKCFNIVGVIEILCNIKSRPKTYSFIKDLFMLEVKNSEWKEKKKEILYDNIQQIIKNKIKIECPTTMKNIRNITRYLEKLHVIAIDNLFDDKQVDNEGNIMFFASIGYLCKMLDISPLNGSKVSQKLAVLAYHTLIRKLDDKEIPLELLRKSVYLAAKSNNNNRISWFSIQSYSFHNYPAIEERGKMWENNQYTMKGVSREMFVRAEGLLIANEVYPQYKKVVKEGQIVDRTTTEESDERVYKIMKAAKSIINIKGYTTEREICLFLNKEIGFKVTSIQIKKAIKQILEFENLEIVYSNKRIKRKYNVSEKGYPKVIILKK